MNLYDIYKATGVHQNTVITWEGGTRRDFLFNKLAKLAAFYGVDVNELIEEYDPTPTPPALQAGAQEATV